MGPQLKIIDFGSLRSGNENEDLSDFWEVKMKSYSSNMKQNNYLEFSGHSFLEIHSKNGP